MIDAVQGECEPRFEAVREEFARNFSQRGEIGAAVAIFYRGELVSDLWGGLANQERGRPWTPETCACVFSATKGLSAICMHILADRGLLDFAAPVARYWPEFAANGKAETTVAMVMAHQAGLPNFQAPIPDGAFMDWSFATERLASEAPVWEPGTQHGYHAVTLGFMQGEIVRRITGKTIGQLLRSEVGEPLGADVWIGLPEGLHHRVATAYLDEPNPRSALFRKINDDPDSIAAKIATNTGNDITPDNINSAARRSSEIPAAGGIATAMGLAKAYRPLSLDGSADGTRILASAALPPMRNVLSASLKDNILQVPTTFTMGFSKSWGDRKLGEGEHVVLGEHAFGTAGMGGSVGFADPEAEFAFAYVMNLHGPGIGLNDRCQSLVDAAYEAVGYRTSDPGYWVR